MKSGNAKICASRKILIRHIIIAIFKIDVHLCSKCKAMITEHIAKGKNRSSLKSPECVIPRLTVNQIERKFGLVGINFEFAFIVFIADRISRCICGIRGLTRKLLIIWSKNIVCIGLFFTYFMSVRSLNIFRRGYIKTNIFFRIIPYFCQSVSKYRWFNCLWFIHHG